jgi:glutamate synthase (NADPH/NADH) small chain
MNEARPLARPAAWCKDPLCIDGCPVACEHFVVRLIMKKDYQGGQQDPRDELPPAICGGSAPGIAVRGRTLGRSTTRCRSKLERFVADFERGWGFSLPDIPVRRDEGRDRRLRPAGLTCAAELAKMGYQVTVFEALHAVGGVLRYGIPEFRLPRDILDLETERIKALGVTIQTNFVVGRTATIDELFDEWGFKAAFLGTGAGTPNFLGIPGESLSGVYSANEFLTRVN